MQWGVPVKEKAEMPNEDLGLQATAGTPALDLTLLLLRFLALRCFAQQRQLTLGADCRLSAESTRSDEDHASKPVRKRV